MRGVLIDNNESVFRFSDDVSLGDLPPRHPKGINMRLRRGSDSCFAPCLWRWRKERRPLVAQQAGTGEVVDRLMPCRDLIVHQRAGFGATVRIGSKCRQDVIRRAMRDAVARFIQGAPQAGNDQAAYHCRVTKTHLRFRWMDIHIDLIRGQINEQRHHRVAIARHHFGVGAADGTDQQPILDGSAVHEKILMIRDAAVECRQSSHSAEHNGLPRHVDRDAILLQGTIGKRRYTSRSIIRLQRGQHSAAIMLHGEDHVRARHRQPPHHVQARCIFAAPGSQELASRRNPFEQAFDNDTRSRWQGSRALRNKGTIVDDAGPAIRAPYPAFQGQPGDAGDGRKRFTAKSHGSDAIDVVSGQLRGGVALKGERHFLRGHSTAVIGHFHAADSAV